MAKPSIPTKLLWFPDCGEPGVRKFHANWFLASNLFQSLRKMMGPPISTPPLPHSTSHKMQIFCNMWWEGKMLLNVRVFHEVAWFHSQSPAKVLANSHNDVKGDDTNVTSWVSIWVSVQTSLKGKLGEICLGISQQMNIRWAQWAIVWSDKWLCSWRKLSPCQTYTDQSLHFRLIPWMFRKSG